MSHSDTMGGEPSGLGARLARVFTSPKPAEDPLQETVEFTPDDVEPAEAAWAPRFATVWRGYDRTAVEEYIRALEDELATVQAQHTPEHAINEEIDRIGADTAAILRVAHEKADAIASRAHAQADLLVAEAQSQAEATTRDAEARRRTLDADADLIWRERTRLIDDTRKLADCMLSVADDAVERFPPETVEPAPQPTEAIQSVEASNGQPAQAKAAPNGPAPSEPSEPAEPAEPPF
jgi:cell division septum initiation protein DivIVA